NALVLTYLLAATEAKQPWFYGSADLAALTLLLLNICLLVGVHVFRLRRYLRRGRSERFRARIEEILSELDSRSSGRNEHSGRRELSRLNELESPIAAAMLVEHMRLMSGEQRARVSAALRD